MGAHSLDCWTLVQALNTLCSNLDRRECNELLAALYVIRHRGPLGRHGLARELGVSERRARTLLDKLRDRRLITVHRVAGAEARSTPLSAILDLLKCRTSNGRTQAAIGPVSENLVRLLENHVLSIRDEIILTLGEPGLLELIGYWREGGIVAPGMPKELVENYEKLVDSLSPENNTIIALYNGYCIYCCTALLYATYMLCRRYSSTSATTNSASQT